MNNNIIMTFNDVLYCYVHRYKFRLIIWRFVKIFILWTKQLSIFNILSSLNIFWEKNTLKKYDLTQIRNGSVLVLIQTDYNNLMIRICYGIQDMWTLSSMIISIGYSHVPYTLRMNIILSTFHF